jgi:hypothetical protein
MLRWATLAAIALLILRCASAAAAPIIVVADGETEPYKVLTNVGFGYEVADCNPRPNSLGVVTPLSAIPHITNTTDRALGNVFDLHLHVVLNGGNTLQYDDDRCFQSDRQRTEIKAGYRGARGDRYLAAFAGDTMEWKWRFKLSAGFQISHQWSVIHSRKAGDGAGMSGYPILQIDATKDPSGDVIRIDYWDRNNQQHILSRTLLVPFLGVWIEADEVETFPTGAYSIIFKRVSDGRILWSYKTGKLDGWRNDNTFVYTKWGLYRGLRSRALSRLRDEQVLLGAVCVAKRPDTCPSPLP